MYYFSKYKKYIIVEKGEFTINNNLYYINKSFEYPLAESEKDNIKTLMKINNGTGKVEIYFNNSIIANIDMTKKAIKKEKKNLLKKFIDLFS